MYKGCAKLEIIKCDRNLKFFLNNTIMIILEYIALWRFNKSQTEILISLISLPEHSIRLKPKNDQVYTYIKFYLLNLVIPKTK